MGYQGRFVHTIGRIQHISLISIIYIFSSTCRLATQTVAPTLPGFQVIKRCVQYLASHPHKPIFYLSNYYDGSNVIRFTWSGSQVEDHTAHIFLGCHQDADHARTINIRRSVLWYYKYSAWSFCLLEVTGFTRYSIWLHWWIKFIHVQSCKEN